MGRGSLPEGSDDIPLARRSGGSSLPGRPAGLPMAMVVLLPLLATGLTIALALGPLRSWLTPPPVAGLPARLDRDGRLLGHFPYPEAPASSLAPVAPGMQLRREAAEALRALQRAAAADGVPITVISAFRSRELQRQLFFEVGAQRNQSPEDRARVSAPPGFSEHSTGYAVDLGDAGRPDTHLSPRFETTSSYAWLVAHGARFHFQLSFPRDNPQGVSYEPWHWRYVGSTEALRLFDPAHRLSRSASGS
jgi:D-alanyl-D-alanine carboxypeptidase